MLVNTCHAKHAETQPFCQECMSKLQSVLVPGRVSMHEKIAQWTSKVFSDASILWGRCVLIH